MDGGKEKVQIFDKSGNFVSQFGGNGLALCSMVTGKGKSDLSFVLPSSSTASLASGCLLLRSLGTIGFRDVTEISLAVNDRAHRERKRPGN